MVASVEQEESWESALLPPRRSVPSRQKRGAPAPSVKVLEATTAAVADAVARRLLTPVEAVATPTAALQQVKKARLVRLQMTNFKCFEDRTISFDGACSCIVGPNSSGKSSIIDAISFIALRPVKHIRGLVRRCRPANLRCVVTAVFETERFESVVLQRSVTLDSAESHTVTNAAGCEGHVEDMPESQYTDWVRNVLGWKADDVILSQFSLLGEGSLLKLLTELPKRLAQLESDDEITAPMLKRRSINGQPSTTACSVHRIRMKAEAWVCRRFDELYCELSREPLDEQFQEWGEGGQACLKRLADGSFTVFVSRIRGLAAAGKGIPMESLSDGDRDLCALALSLLFPGLTSGMRDVLPPLVIFDEPDSRLDKRAACCLTRLLSGPTCPAQCIVVSLNNHGAFKDLPEMINLPELDAAPLVFDGDDDPYGDARPRKKAAGAAQ